jgi:hypothetical protein
MEALNGGNAAAGAGGGFGFSAKPQVIANKNGAPYRDPYREYV